MGFLERLKDAIGANVDYEIAKRENPSIMADYHLRKAEKQLIEAREKTENTIAQRNAAERENRSVDSDLKKVDEAIKEMLIAGNDEATKELLQVKSDFLARKEAASSALETALNNEKTMVQAYRSLEEQVKSMRTRNNSIAAVVNTAETKRYATQCEDSMNNSAVGKFAEYEKKAQTMLDATNASVGLTEADPKKILDKYTKPKFDAEAELARLKAERRMLLEAK